MKPSQVSQLLAATIPAKLPVLLTGAPGIGKTSIVEQTAAFLNYDLVVSHPVVADPTDAKGLPWPDRDGGTAKFLPFGELARVLQSTRPTIWFIDDLGQAPAAVQASFMGWLLARRFGEHVLPDGVSMVAATNRRQDRAGVNGILEPVKGRMASIVEVQADVQDFSAWAFAQGWFPAEPIAFLRFRPTLLSDFKATTELTNSPSPRGWAFLAKLYNLKLPPEVQLEALAGAVGEGAAVEFLAFCQMYKSLVSVDQILMDPTNAKIPDRPDALYAVTSALAMRANDQNYGRVGVYCERLAKAGLGEYAALAIRDCLRRDGNLATTPEHTRIMSGEIGRLVLGEAR